ncbi:NAD(P)/FAD-dependent oxidoreductase [Marasmitruncus massiliensis]|uniref:NAD(P)/FAD-dependent oxidoreductase n=1 Tax=Marasmitruncus massiliensis TaxID=1944642 RepID=UPI001FA90871|nr:NAD(P)/FAD-dependent oxidoreductase [Marasmitruncus massiliensis]
MKNMRKMSVSNKAVIIGGGAAGLFCAGLAAQRGLDVTVLDKNAKPARKLLITGKGRCNVTNNCTPEDFLQNVRTNPRFLYSAIHAFAPADTMRFFEERGVPLKTERGSRVFPVSDKAVEIVDTLTAFAKQSGVKIVPKTRAAAVSCENGAVTGVVCEDRQKFDAAAVVIATGGASYPLTGSNGDGYRLAAQLGHSVIPSRPSLVPVVTAEPWCAEMMGLSLKNVTLTLKNANNKVVYQELGEMLFTHFGISGPLVLSASSYMTEPPQTYRMSIDMKPALEPDQLDARILRDFEEQKNKDFANSLDALLPRKMIPVVVRLSGIPADTKVNSVTREQRRKLVSLIKALPLTPIRFRPIEEAIITSGGVSVKEISPKTMESKLINGLFFAGEVIDVDAFTGGFNLQIAFATAFLAAQSLCPEQ